MATWKVSTWFRKTRPSEVRKNGTDEDKAKLPPAGKLNNPHSRKRSFEVPSRRKANKGVRRSMMKQLAGKMCRLFCKCVFVVIC